MTDPTADAAKLLPCPFCGSSQIELHRNGKWAGCTQCGAGVSSKTWNTRPQPATPDYDDEITADNIAALNKIAPDEEFKDFKPAPPAGEPDFEQLWVDHISEFGTAKGWKAAVSFATRMYRLGQTSRQKVEDAEIQGKLRAEESAHIETANYADSLEGELFATQKRAEAAEAKMAYCEAELVKDRDQIAERIVVGVAEIPDRNSPDDQPEMMLVTDKELRGIVINALEDHAARQEQKASAEPTASSKAEETR